MPSFQGWCLLPMSRSRCPPPAAAADKADAAAARDAIVPTPAGPTHDQRKATIDRYNSKQERRAGGGVELTAEA